MYRITIVLLALCAGCATADIGGSWRPTPPPAPLAPSPACADARTASMTAEVKAEDADAEFERECPPEKRQGLKCVDLAHARRLAHVHQGDMADRAIAACEPPNMARK